MRPKKMPIEFYHPIVVSQHRSAQIHHVLESRQVEMRIAEDCQNAIVLRIKIGRRADRPKRQAATVCSMFADRLRVGQDRDIGQIRNTRERMARIVRDPGSVGRPRRGDRDAWSSYFPAVGDARSVGRNARQELIWNRRDPLTDGERVGSVTQIMPLCLQDRFSLSDDRAHRPSHVDCARWRGQPRSGAQQFTMRWNVRSNNRSSTADRLRHRN